MTQIQTAPRSLRADQSADWTARLVAVGLLLTAFVVVISIIASNS